MKKVLLAFIITHWVSHYFQIFWAISCLHSCVSGLVRCPVTGEGGLACLDGVFNELPHPGAARLCALRAQRNHSPPMWNNEVWRVIVEQVAFRESLQDCTWHAWRVRGDTSVWMHTNSSREHAWTHGRANICRLNSINANSKPQRRLLQRNENFSRNLRLIIGCKFAVMPVIRGDATVEREMKPAARLSSN